LKAFTNALDGANPQGTLALSGNMLYGTTVFGGSSNLGTAFAVGTDGTGFTVLKNFGGNDGENPEAGLIVSSNVLYGTTFFGGTASSGTVVQAQHQRVLDSPWLKSFTFVDGTRPNAGVTLLGNVLYGATYFDGLLGGGTLYHVNTDGTTFTVLKHFDVNSNDGVNCQATLLLSNGVIYGTTTFGGSSNNGTVFSASTLGTGYTVLQDFSGSDGMNSRRGPDVVRRSASMERPRAAAVQIMGRYSH